jgi:DNA modification methylase
MHSQAQLSLFAPQQDKKQYITQDITQEARSGTFTDNMKLPIHRWFRYSAGFSAAWVEDVLQTSNATIVLDPFVGSGTVCVAADKLGITSYGIESHPFIFRLARGKIAWAESINLFEIAIASLIETAMKMNIKTSTDDTPLLIEKCYSDENLQDLYSIKSAYFKLSSGWSKSIEDLVFLTINSILRATSKVGTAQWQYVLPNKTKSRVTSPYTALNLQSKMMIDDMRFIQSNSKKTQANLLQSDARTLLGVPDKSIDLVVTSPPYANNYDYADATRLEMTFWGEINSWSDLHESVRQYLICSSSQHASKDKIKLDLLLNNPDLISIAEELSIVCKELDKVRKTKGGNKAYHLMIAAYFGDMAKVFKALRRVTKVGATVCLVIGDSAPYGVHAPVERWFGEMALAHGFESWEFEKIRDRNIKWKNRKHDVLLHEGRLWIKG